MPITAESTRERRSRMVRTSIGKRIEITSRDVEIFKLLSRYQYLRSSFLHAFVGGDRVRFIERLGDLYHEGYLDRPEQQWQFANCRYMPVIHELGAKGERILRDHRLMSEPLKSLRTGACRQFPHQLMVCDILASIELGVRCDGALRFIGHDEIINRAPERTRALPNPLHIPVSISYPSPRAAKTHQAAINIVPDALFGLEYLSSGKKSYRFFALEADRNKMPVARRNLQQSSYLRKLLAYREIVAQGVFKAHFGLPNLLVLTVTTGEQHVKNIMAFLHNLTGGRGSTFFLFKTASSRGDFQAAPSPAPDMLTTPWNRVGYEPFLICEP